MKKTISFILILVLLLAVPSFAPTAAQTDSSADELAPAGSVYTYSANTFAKLKSYLETNAPNDTVIINVTSDISEVINSSYSVFTPVWCIVGKGKKILNLNQHTVNLKSMYCAGYVYAEEENLNIIEAHSTERLFSIPSGAYLTVNGGYTDNRWGAEMTGVPSAGNIGQIIFDGVIVENTDGIDQRDIFFVSGGSLTVNSGKYYTHDVHKRYDYSRKNGTVTEYWHKYTQVNGTAVTANSGSVTINGGYFEGKGYREYFYDIDTNSTVYDYHTTCNAALEVSTSANVKIYGGFFYGVDNASAVKYGSYTFDPSNFKVYSGEFGVDTEEQVFAVDYSKYGKTLRNTGYIGLPVNNLNTYSNYYIGEGSHLITQSEVYSDPSTLLFMREEHIYIEPISSYPRVSGKGLATTPLTSLTCLEPDYITVHDTNNPYIYDGSIAGTFRIRSNGFFFPEPDSYSSDDIHRSVTITANIYRWDGSTRRAIASAVSVPVTTVRGDWAFTIRSVFESAGLSDQLNNPKKFDLVMTVIEQHAIQNGSDYREFKIDHPLQIAIQIPRSESEVSGTVTTFLNPLDTVTVQLIKGGSVKYSTTLTRNSASYEFPSVAKGIYTLRVKKNNHATRDYSISVYDHVYTEVKIHPLGDIDGDGAATTFDYAQVMAHAKGVRLLTDYALECAKVAGGDDEVTTFDAAAINAHAKRVKLMWPTSYVVRPT